MGNYLNKYRRNTGENSKTLHEENYQANQYIQKEHNLAHYKLSQDLKLDQDSYFHQFCSTKYCTVSGNQAKEQEKDKRHLSSKRKKSNCP